MKNMKKLTKPWLASILAVVVLGIATPTIAFAADDAGPVAAAVEPAVVAAPELEPKPEPVAAAVVEVAPATVAVPAEKELTALAKFSTEIMNVLVPIFVTLIGALATLLLNWVRKKTKLEVSDKQIASWSAYAELGAARAGEWARNKANAAADGKKVPGPEVMEVAVNFAIDMGKQYKLPEMGREKLEGLIEGHLHKTRAPAAA